MGKPPEPPKPNFVVLYELAKFAGSGIAKFLRHKHGGAGSFSDYDDGDFYVSPYLLSRPEDAMIVRKRKARRAPRTSAPEGIAEWAIWEWDKSTGGAASALGIRECAEFFAGLSSNSGRNGNVGEHYAGILACSLEKHLGMEFPESARHGFIDAIACSAAPRSSELYSRLPVAVHSFSDAGFHYDITLRRIVHNRAAGMRSRSLEFAPVLQLARLASLLGVRSSTLLLADLLRNREVADAMGKCKCPYSLIAKAELYEVTENSAYSSKKPVIAIPGYEANPAVMKWERRNAKESTCEKDSYLIPI